MKGYYKVTGRRVSMEPASAAGGGSGKKATGNNNSRGGGGGDDDNSAAPSSSLLGRPALADLINGTGVFAQENEQQQLLLEQQDAPPTKRQRTLWPTPGAAAGGGGLQVRSGRIAPWLSREKSESLLGERGWRFFLPFPAPTNI